MPVLKIKENGVWVPVSGMSGHTHTKDDITDLQSSLDELLQSSKDYTDSVIDSKVESNHGTHVSYSTDAPVMDGTANAGSASTVARSDHRHPTDTSRASKTELDALSELVGDEAVSKQIEDAIANKSDIDHNHDDRYYTESEVDALIKEVDWFGIGTSIPSNSDLNTYNTPGKYYVGSTSVSQTILNSPITDDNFALFVFARTSSNSTSLTQMIISLGSNLYIRSNSSNGEWRNWNKYAKASEVIKNLSVSGQTITYTKGDGTTGTITTQDTDTIYTHPAYTAKNSGLYKVTVDATGHISATANVAKSDITALGIPAQDTTYSIATTSADGLMSKSDKSKLDTVSSLVGDTAVSAQISTAISNKSDVNHTHSAYINQNAFSKVLVGSTTIEADSATDTLTLVAGSNVTLTPDASGDKVTIAATDTVYTHPSSGATAGTYKSVTVNAQGHVTGGSNPTTLSGYGITDAATKTEFNTLSGLVGDRKVSEQISTAIASKSDTGHIHDDRYYTESEVNALIKEVDWFKAGTSIPSNSDLDTYNTPGKYYVGSTSASKTILNSPVTNDNFVLFVFARTSSNSASLTQMIITLGSSFYIRNNNSSGEWRDWYRYAKASEIIKSLSASGRTITYTKGDDTTGTITTQDTTYSVATTSADGLMSKSDKSKLDSVSSLIGDKAVSEQINDAIGNIKGLPGVTTSDNGKFLRVVSGTWKAVAISSAEGSSF